MNKDEWRKALPVIEGFIEGKPVQYFDPLAGRWFDTKNIDEMDKFIYRIKPEAREFMIEDTTGPYIRRISIEGYKRHKINDSLEKWIKVREVIE